MIFLITQCEKEAVIIPIDIPDNAFLNTLIEEGVDSNQPGNLSDHWKEDYNENHPHGSL